MEDRQERIQWFMQVNVSHGPSFGHRIELVCGNRGRTPWFRTIGSWTGFGCPPDVLEQATALLMAVFQEHILTRYGEQSSLPGKWAGEVGSS